MQASRLLGIRASAVPCRCLQTFRQRAESHSLPNTPAAAHALGHRHHSSVVMAASAVEVETPQQESITSAGLHPPDSDFTLDPSLDVDSVLGTGAQRER